MGSSGSESKASGDASSSELIGALDQGRRQFLQLVDHIRPELHRYCARMTGSVADGEDVVQDTLARACYELSQMKALPALRPWLFRIAHNRAIDHWRHERHRASEPIEVALEIAAEAAFEPDNVMARGQAVQAALTGFLALAPAQRGCVILKDVLDHSLEEIATELNLSVAAVKAALHRGRAALRDAADAPKSAAPGRDVSAALGRYASLFNAHDWDGIRALLADDVRLDLVAHRKAAGRREVGQYLDNYERAVDWRMVPVWLEGREALAVVADTSTAQPRYFIELGWSDAGQVATIRDFRYVSYIAREASFDFAA
jgi:RNA polymerase sigma-70 factor (ECF subfamily)